MMLGTLFGVNFEQSWFTLMTSIIFRTVKDKSIPYEEQKRGLMFTKGQPLGIYSSWPVFTLTHHMLVWLAADKVRPGAVFLDYAILGDDLVIACPKVAEEYIRMIEVMKVTISQEKSLVSSIGACEFAKKFRVDRGGFQSNIS